MHLAEPIKIFLAMRRVKIEAKHLLLKFKSHLRGDFGVWHLLKSHCEKWVQKSPEAASPLGFLGWHPNWMHNMARCTEKDIIINYFSTVSISALLITFAVYEFSPSLPL